MQGNSPAALVLYHYLYPDDVVSAVLFTELSAGLVERGWQVDASSCNRGWNDDGTTYPECKSFQGVRLRRVWRPAFRQSSGFGRIANAAWMIAAWSLLALNPKIRCDVLVVGTDPVLSPAVALVWRLMRPRVKIAHWCFDLYPEAAIAAGLFREEARSVRFLKSLMRLSYRRCHLIVDLGCCMRRLLERYGSRAHFETIVPWALNEVAEPAPIDADERRELFGNAHLGLLYSGNFGRAHSWQGIPELARLLAPHGCRVAFSVRGNAVEELRNSIGESGADIFFASYAASDRTQVRLSAADIHIVSLRDEWTGTVVPSKFFSALAIGRPVLYLGSRDSAIARLIEEFRVGWVLTGENLHSVVSEVLLLSASAPEKAMLFERCHRVYWQNFSRSNSLDRWDRVLRRLL